MILFKQINLKIAKKRGYKIELLKEIVDILADGGTLAEKYKDNVFIGNYVGCRHTENI